MCSILPSVDAGNGGDGTVSYVLLHRPGSGQLKQT